MTTPADSGEGKTPVADGAQGSVRDPGAPFHSVLVLPGAPGSWEPPAPASTPTQRMQTRRSAESTAWKQRASHHPTPHESGRLTASLCVQLILGVACIVSEITRTWLATPSPLDYAIVAAGVVLCGMPFLREVRVNVRGSEVETSPEPLPRLNDDSARVPSKVAPLSCG